MQIRSFRGSGEPAWVIALPSACERLGPDPRRALGPAAIRAASTGRTRDRTRPMLHTNVRKFLPRRRPHVTPKRTNVGGDNGAFACATSNRRVTHREHEKANTSLKELPLILCGGMHRCGTYRRHKTKFRCLGASFSPISLRRENARAIRG
jgi:hypothetical protein